MKQRLNVWRAVGMILALAAAPFIFSCGEKKQGEGAKVVPEPQKFSIQDISLRDSGGNYSLDVTYPQSGNERLDTLVSYFVHTGMAQFKEAIGTDTPSHNWKNELVMKCSSVLTGDRYVSFKFDTYIFTGGAHGMSFIKTLNYDRGANRVLTLDDLLNAPYLDTLSVISYQMLKDSLGADAVEEMLRAGTTPKPESFQRFQLTPAGIQFHFEPYAVAPYAWGARQVTIPYARLAGMMKKK